MNIDLIKIYINNLTETEAKRFLEKQDIILENDKFNKIFQLIKNNYKEIIDEDKYILEKIKGYTSIDNYNKLYNLFLKYKKYLK